MHSKGDVYIDACYYEYEGEYYVDVDTYRESSAGDDGTTGGDGTTDDTQADKTEVSVTKTADEMAASIGKSNNGDTVGDADIKLDENIYVRYGKGTANTEPALYSGAIRIYQNGGTLTVTAKNGRTIKSVIITFDSDKDGNGKLTATGGTVTYGTETVTVTAKDGATAITLTVSGADKADRLYVTSLKVVYIGQKGDGTTPDTPEEPDTGEGDGTDGEHLYYDFTESEKATYSEYLGFAIPFLPTDEYTVDAYDEDGYVGVYYSALCDSETAFTWYLAAFSSYSSDGTETDEYGDVWYLYSKDNYYIDVCYYEYEGAHYVDVDAYYEKSASGGDDTTGGDDTSGGSGGTTDESVITNAGAGLPSDDGDGIYDVDFTDADKVKDVTDQGYYLDGCPTVGSPAVLVIPVDFSDRAAADLGYTVEGIENAFLEGGKNDYYSVYDYYYASSYGKLTLDITVLDSWFRPENTSSYYAEQTMEYDGQDVMIGDQMIIDEALSYLATVMDLSEFDSDSNGIIDSVVLITTLAIDPDEDFYWAYRYWNIYTDDEGYYYEYDGVSANDYLWAPYAFLHEDPASEENDYTDTSIMNTYTFIHEFGHVLGADDYYDTAYVGAPLGGYDIMDAMIGDQNAYTKFNLGWLTSSRLVVAEGSLTLTIDAFSENGDTVIIANNFDPSLGVYQEYYILVYYTSEGLNSGMGGYFEESGILVYHVNASLYSETYEGEIYYDVYNNNTDPSDSYGTENDLIEFITHGGEYVYTEGDSLGETYDDLGERLGYTFTVDSLTEDTATVTIERIS